MAQLLPPSGTELKLSITGLNHLGEGVGRWGAATEAAGDRGVVVFVPQALPGEAVTARVTYQAKGHVLAELIERHNTAAERRRPPCILAERCGGCSVQHLVDDAQARWKQDLVQQALQRIGGFSLAVEPIMAAAEPLAYRNRAVIPLERGPDGALRAGFYRSGSHKIVNMNRCPVLDGRIDRLIAPLKQELEASDWPVDVDRSEGGGLRHLALRVGHHSGEVLVTLISSHSQLPGLSERAEAWMERWPELVGVCLNLQPLPTNTLMGPRTEVIAGRGWLSERFCGHELRIAPDTFFQVHTPQAERLVPLLVDALEPRAGRTLVEAYCGIGTFGLPLAATGATVRGLELHPPSVEQARLNAALNGLNGLTVESADVAEALVELLPEADGLLLDPPRKGLPEHVAAVISACPPRRVAYLSCNPATFARDLARLTQESGLKLLSVQPIDFFPQTSHVEALAVLAAS